MDELMTLFRFIQDNLDEIGEQTVEHIWLTLFSLVIAVIVGVSTGVFLSRRKDLSGPVISFVNVIQTIPSLALLGFLLPLFGIGVVPAIIALFLYALLPIVRNTFTGIEEVDHDVREAAQGMGMTNFQILTKVELPLAVPVMFAGIRTAMVINVGLATLCALIAAGGLGEFIFRGIAVNNVNMVLAGAIPASLLALFFDFVLGLLQKHILVTFKPLLIVTLVVVILIPVVHFSNTSGDNLKAGFPSEFIHREDGFQGLRKTYQMDIETVEMEIGLMYQALKNHDVDVISGFSTDGRIEAFNLQSLEDNKGYFPPYHAAATVRGGALRRYPELREAFGLIGGRISDEEMIRLNYQVDHFKKSPRDVARTFLESIQLNTSRDNGGNPDLIIGSKNFTESFILAEMFSLLIENYTNLTVDLRLGFGGTKLVFEALKQGEIDLYPEYSGTGLLVILQPDSVVLKSLPRTKEAVFQYVQDKYRSRFDIEWMPPLGFNNTFALMMRKEHAQELGIYSISDLKDYLDSF